MRESVKITDSVEDVQAQITQERGSTIVHVIKQEGLSEFHYARQSEKLLDCRSLFL